VCCRVERGATDDKTPPVDVSEYDTGPEPEPAVKCDDEDDTTTTSTGADSQPAAVPPASPGLPGSTDTDAVPDDSSQSASADVSPTHSCDADTNSDSLVTNADACLSSEPLAADN